MSRASFNHRKVLLAKELSLILAPMRLNNNRAQAFTYALFENDHHPLSIVEVLRELELHIPANPQIAGRGAWPDTSAQLTRALRFAAPPIL